MCIAAFFFYVGHVIKPSWSFSGDGWYADNYRDWSDLDSDIFCLCLFVFLESSQLDSVNSEDVKKNAVIFFRGHVNDKTIDI